MIWGTDCLWWGSPQWAIDAFKRFQISDELCDKFGYKKLTKEDKAKIFGLNAARLYWHRRRRKAQEPAQGRAVEAEDGLSTTIGGTRDNAAYGWVRDDSNV